MSPGDTSTGAEFDRWRGLLELQVTAPFGLALGVLAGLWAWAWLNRFRGSWLVAWAGAALLLSVIAVDGATPEHFRAAHALTYVGRPGTKECVLAIGALGVALVAVLGIVTRNRESTVGRRFAMATTLLLLLVATPFLADAYVASNAPAMRTTEVRREVILEEGAWKVLQENPKHPPHVGILMPSSDHRVDAGELPSLIMPPPCAVSFEVTEEDGAVFLQIAAGADESVSAKKMRRLHPVGLSGFGFEIEVNGESVFSAKEPLHLPKTKRVTSGKRTWLRPQDPEGIRLVPGDKVTLRTRLLGVKKKAAIEGPLYRVGFGNVLLQHNVEYPRRPASPDTPNIVLIVQDTLRGDRCSTLGYELDTTPALSRLAARGISFTQAHSVASWTWPSTASILTGQLPSAHGVTDDDSCYLIGRNETLAEVLQQRGYTTGAFACNPLISEAKNFNQGFESFSASGRTFVKTDQIMSSVEEWLRTREGVRFFLYLHLVDPHMPHEPSTDTVQRLANDVPEGFGSEREVHKLYKGRALAGGGLDEDGNPLPAKFPEGHIEYMSSMYDASVATGDEYLGAITDLLQELGLADNTIVAFTSDHGEAWMDHGGLTHGQSVHRELVRVPLVIAGPGLAEGITCDTPVSNRHIAATLAAIGGAEMTRVHDALILTDPDSIPQAPVFFSTIHGSWNNRRGRQPIYGVRDGDLVLHYAPEGADYGVAVGDRPVGGQYRLYDLSSDPQEHVDIADQFPADAERLKMLILDNLAAQLKTREGRLDVGSGADTMRMLDGIGYNVGKVEDDDE